MNEAKRVPAAKPGADLDSNLDLSRIKTVEGVDVRGKRVLVRVDFNVPIENGVCRPSPDWPPPARKSSCCRISAAPRKARLPTRHCGLSR